MGLSAHQKNGGHDEWLTPPEILRALGEFDLDPCAPVVRPWETAARHYTVADDGLALPWRWPWPCNRNTKGRCCEHAGLHDGRRAPRPHGAHGSKDVCAWCLCDAASRMQGGRQDAQRWQ